MPKYPTIAAYLKAANINLTSKQLEELERTAEFQYADDRPHDIDGTELDFNDLVQLPDSDEVVGVIVTLSPTMVGYIDVNTGNHVIYPADRLRLVPPSDSEDDTSTPPDCLFIAPPFAMGMN